MINIEEEFRATTQNIVRSNGNAAPAEARYEFVSLGEKVVTAMVQVAEAQVTEAQNKLNETRAWADGILQQIRAKDRELAEMTDRIRTLGERVLEANEEFNNSIKGG